MIELSFPTSPREPPLERTASLAKPAVAVVVRPVRAENLRNNHPPDPCCPFGPEFELPKEPDHKPKSRNDRTVHSLDQLFTTGEFITIDSTGKL